MGPVKTFSRINRVTSKPLATKHLTTKNTKYTKS